MIPEAAVEAACRALFPNDPDANASTSSFWAPTINTILEAAAPHMLGAAWNEGYLALADDTFRDQELRKQGGGLEHPTANPYTHDDTQGEPR